MEGRRIKNNKAFQELLNVFMPEKHNFIEFDSVKDEVKRRMNMIIVNEEWKEIDGFNYSVSNYGRIKNNTTDKVKNWRAGRFGYQINLWNKGKARMFTISRLVANYYIREVKDSERVRHIDGDTRNNYFKNLEIVNREGVIKMLKICDNVDLKELEKFGYEEHDIGLNEPYIVYKKYIKSFISIDILPDGTIIKNNDDYEGIIKNEDIQDLIQAGLVEKVE